MKQTLGRPVEALQDLQKSVELNDNRAVNRSRLLLDQDRAARTANLADIYRDTGFEQLAVAQARSSISVDPNNYAAHQFLADAYQGVPKQEVARASEQLQALIRAPIGVIPVSPFRGLATPLPLINSGLPPTPALAITPLRSSIDRYDSLYERPSVHLFADALVASQDTVSSQFVVAGSGGAAAFSAGYGTFSTDGFGQNHNFEHTGADFFAQIQASEQLHLQAELWTTKTDRTLTSLTGRNPQQVRDEASTLRVGARYEPDASSAVYLSTSTQSFQQHIVARTFAGP